MDFDIVPFEDIVWGPRIGGGSFGSVYRGQYLGIDIAIKEIHSSTQYDVRKYFEREWRIMRECRHPNIVLFLGLCKEPGANGRVFICSEYVDGGNLRALIRAKDKPFPWHQRLKYCLDLTKALAYLHSRNCLHRDLKGENLLLTDNGSLKVTDFGFARIASRNVDEMRHMTYCGTDGYMSPEIIMGEDFDLPTDIYSMGIIFLELCTRILISSKVYHPESKKKPPVFVPDRNELLKHLDTGCPLEFFELALHCLSFTAGDRPVVTEVLRRLEAMYATCLSMMDGADEPMAVEQPTSPTEPRQIRKGKRRAMPIFDEEGSSERAEKEVEMEVGGFSDSSSDSDEDEEPRRGRQREQKHIQVIANKHVRIEGDGAIRRRKTRRRTVTQEWLDSHTRTRSSSPSMKSCNQGYVQAESSIASEETARQGLLDSQVSAGTTAAATVLTTLSSPVDITMPCAYPPSPPEEACSTFTIRGVAEPIALPTPLSRAATCASPRPLRPPPAPLRSARPPPIQVPQSPKSIITSLPSPGTPQTPEFPQPLQLQQSLAPLQRRQSAKVNNTPKSPTIPARNLIQHKFTISAKSQTTMAAVLQGTKRIPSTLISASPNWANLFYSSSSSRNKCKVCSKKLGLNYLQCNECHALIHAKCKSVEYNFLCNAFPTQQLGPDP